MSFLQRLSALVIVMVVGFLVFWLPGGPIIMGMSCKSGLDGWDWIFSIFVPFYGVATSVFC